MATDFGVEDNWPVFCEPFKQWVLEDHFPTGRPALEKVGVTFVKDVAPYELMKIRILNGGHAAIAYPGSVDGYSFCPRGHGGAIDPRIPDQSLSGRRLFRSCRPYPDMPFEDYFDLIVRRFSNPKIGDTIQRLCQDGSNRQPKFILPTTADRLKAGKSITGLSLVSALWCRFCAGTTDTASRRIISMPALSD